MKRGNKNNAFTEALGAELSTRKVLEKAKDNAETRILMADMEGEFEPDTIAEPIDSTKPVYAPPVRYLSEVEPKSRKKTKAKTKVKKVSDKTAAPKKKSAPEKVSDKKISVSKKIEPETEFEKRVFAEADNDFYDEKIPQNIGNNMRSNVTEKIAEKLPDSQTAFRSKFVNKQLEDLKDKNSDVEGENAPDLDPELHRKLTRAEMAGVALSALLMIDAYINLDKPLFFIALSLFVHLMRPLFGAFCGKYNRAVQNGMRSFSFVLFIGAIIILFLMD